jgi:aminotransferase in exopolysaccharide biosynthesis
MQQHFSNSINFIQELYPNKSFIPLHEPTFAGNEKAYVLDTIDSTFVSSVGAYVDKFEAMMRDYTGAKYAIAVVNGTAALHIALKLAGVKEGDLVLTQALSFVATCNAISYLNAEPCFVDISTETLGMCPQALKRFLNNVEVVNNTPIHKPTGKRIGACVPMHTFGFPAEIDTLVDLCNEYQIPLIEDAAESIGSTYKTKQTGTFGLLGTFSFNGNKTITCGGGGIIVTNDDELGPLAKHLTTQAKVPHKWEFVHDHIGYNYRCPNLNAALACAQLEQLDNFIENKRQTAKLYERFFTNTPITFIVEPANTKSNYWLNAVLLKNKDERDEFLTITNAKGVMTRPAWTLMNKLAMFARCMHDGLPNSLDIEARLVNIPSSVRG